jgi:BRCT domain type II-containing protein
MKGGNGPDLTIGMSATGGNGDRAGTARKKKEGRDEECHLD